MGVTSVGPLSARTLDLAGAAVEALAGGAAEVVAGGAASPRVVCDCGATYSNWTVLLFASLAFLAFSASVWSIRSCFCSPPIAAAMTWLGFVGSLTDALRASLGPFIWSSTKQGVSRIFSNTIALGKHTSCHRRAGDIGRSRGGARDEAHYMREIAQPAVARHLEQIGALSGVRNENAL